MLEWTIITVLIATTFALAYLCFNFAKTLKNIQLRLYDLQLRVSEFTQLVEKVNGSETYYGDPVIQALVDATNEIEETLKDVAQIQEEIAGDAEEEN